MLLPIKSAYIKRHVITQIQSIIFLLAQRLVRNHCIILLKILRRLSMETKLVHLFKLGFTPCKAEELIQGITLQEKEAEKS